jgi:uncharacterized protein YdeI (YjbR/CyaY-like superfamily)
MSWSESVDQALCYGWIDGVRKRVDDERYTIRFTPRKAGSIWSAVNIDKIARLHAHPDHRRRPGHRRQPVRLPVGQTPAICRNTRPMA